MARCPTWVPLVILPERSRRTQDKLRQRADRRHFCIDTALLFLKIFFPAGVPVAQLHTKAESLVANSTGYCSTVASMTAIPFVGLNACYTNAYVHSWLELGGALFRKAMPYAIGFTPFRGCATGTTCPRQRTMAIEAGEDVFR